MAQSLGQVYLHIVFSTKNRFPYLADPEMRRAMYAYLLGICDRAGCPPLRVGGVEDHVHVACKLARTMRISDLLMVLKRDSSNWIKTKDASLESFYWQNGYGVFSVSPQFLGALVEYIDGQEEHHKTVSFQDEMRSLFKKYDVDYDDRYVWN